MAGGQVQVGGVTVQTDAPNPLGGVLAGINTGADWAVKSQELDQRAQALDAERQKTQIALLKNKLDVGSHLYDRMKKISRLPLGAVKDNEIDLLGNDMNSLGMQLHPSAVALMKDKNLSQNIAPVLDSMNDPDPVKHIQAMGALPYLLSDEKITDYFLKRQEELGKNSRAVVTGMANIEAAKTKQDTEKFKVDANAQLQNQLVDKRTQAEKDIASQRTDTEKTIAGARMAFEEAQDKKKSVVELRKEASENSKEFERWHRTANTVYSAAAKVTPTGLAGADAFAMIKAFNQFNDSPRVTEGEAKFLNESTRSFVDGIRSWAQRNAEAKTLTSAQVEQINSATKTLHAVIIKQNRDQMSPLQQQAKDQGLDPNKIFTPIQRRILGIEPPAAVPSKTAPVAPAAAVSQPAASPVAPQAAAPTQPAAPAQQPVQLSDQALQAAKAYINTGADMASRIAKSIELEVRKGFKFTPQQRAMLGLPPAKGVQ